MSFTSHGEPEACRRHQFADVSCIESIDHDDKVFDLWSAKTLTRLSVE